MQIILEWAGRERVFALRFGEVLALEQACGDGKAPEAIGAIFQRVSTGRFRAADLFHILKQGLIGGGMGVLQADKLMRDHFDTQPYLQTATVAGEIMLGLMSGIEPSEGAAGDASSPEPYRFSEVSQICRVFNMSPADLKAMPYADFVNMLRGFNAGSQKKADMISEEEFADLLAKYEPEAM